MMKKYVEFLFPGSMFIETSEEEIESFTVPIKLPKGAFGYRFYQQQQIESEGEILYGEQKYEKGTYFKGKVYTKGEVKKKEGEGVLYRNMDSNNWYRAIKTISGNWQPFTKDDKLIKD